MGICLMEPLIIHDFWILLQAPTVYPSECVLSYPRFTFSLFHINQSLERTSYPPEVTHFTHFSLLLTLLYLCLMFWDGVFSAFSQSRRGENPHPHITSHHTCIYKYKLSISTLTVYLNPLLLDHTSVVSKTWKAVLLSVFISFISWPLGITVLFFFLQHLPGLVDVSFVVDKSIPRWESVPQLGFECLLSPARCLCIHVAPA